MNVYECLTVEVVDHGSVLYNYHTFHHILYYIIILIGLEESFLRALDITLIVSHLFNFIVFVYELKLDEFN